MGRALYAELAKLAGTLGAQFLCCEVNTSPANPGSLEFHRRLEFTQIGAMDTSDGRTVPLLRRDLAG